jgi:hypothetical protein
MDQGLAVFVIPVRDVAQAKTLYSTLLDAESYVDRGGKLTASLKDADGNVIGLIQTP